MQRKGCLYEKRQDDKQGGGTQVPLFWGIRRVSFPEATTAFYSSNTYVILQNTENALWAESAGYIADRYFDEQSVSV